MSSIDEHCRESLAVFGKEFREAHDWLDYFCGKKGVDKNGKPYDYTGYPRVNWHKEQRHNHEGIEEGVMRFGEEARKVMEYHINQDFEGTIMDHIPFKKEYGETEEEKQRFWSKMMKKPEY